METAQDRTKHKIKQAKPTRPIMYFSTMLNATRKIITAAALLLFALATATAAAPLLPDEIRIHYIDVGQGDAILIQSARNAALIDGGDTPAQAALFNYLKSAGIDTLNYVIATHPHTDHIGGLSMVIRQFEVKSVVMMDTVYSSKIFKNLFATIKKKNLKITIPNVGDTLAAGIIQFIVIAPTQKFRNLNDMSAVVRMEHGETSFLFTGDAEKASEREMLKSQQPLRSDVLKAGHHGSRTSTTAAFLDAVTPKAAVISCGKGNSYKHPHPKTLDKLKRRNINLFRTDETGTVIITTDGQKITLPPTAKGQTPP
jgi:DNA internalization-related competence protein ComEC/Rec2